MHERDRRGGAFPLALDQGAAARTQLLRGDQAASARLGVADAGGGHRVILQHAGRIAHAACVGAEHVLHVREETGHAARVETRIGQGLDAGAVGLDLVLAGEVDRALRDQPLAAGQHRHRRVAGIVGGARGKRAQQHQRHQWSILA